MNRSIGRVAAVVLVLFGALFVNLNVITLLQADDLATHPANRRLIIREYAIERGPIVVGEEAIARSVATETGDLRYLRTYADGPLYAHITGYYSFLLQRSGLESSLNEDLTGRSTEEVAQNLGELLGASDRAGNAVVLTIDPAVQQAAADALGGVTGAVVALDPSSGAVLASYANPTYDPNPLSSHDAAEIRQTWEELNADESRPLVDRALRETFPPGSTFKLITAAAALEAGVQPDDRFEDPAAFDVPQTTADIRNFGGGRCNDGQPLTLAHAIRVSCNTTFAELALQLGAEGLADQAERFGFNNQVPFELPVATSAIPREQDLPSVAQSGIGQRDVRATPMQMALLTASIANGGQLVRPHLVASVRDPAGRQLRGPAGAAWEIRGSGDTPVSPRTAEQLRRMMVDVVENGTGTRAAIDGVEVGGKTGTAQTGGDPTVWFVGFAGDDVAVAVVLPSSSEDATGGALAAPIARSVMQAALDR
ncbi:peptidoglycan D,D-transpeptidase FtsI family protein [Nitriliruptor alkaliphilus]|uniref:peptidoglycan D,D-transpeptidase FtsI family protein n=1 Tax=Nitriliruptor alkaliphilus TaxID=427918 RepID=UPI00069618E5|nr:penicillin-binding transpeptidase domain-containing protein [Nitriliruptor alkaliphilus]